MVGASDLDSLNDAQREAVCHGSPPATGATVAGPLLVIAGAGSGKTSTLAHRVAHLIQHGADPRRVLLLTFSRRSAVEMTRRAEQILGRLRAKEDETWDAPVRVDGGRLRWSGTFHAVANRLLRLYADVAGLDPAFTVLDRSDAADLLDWLRADLQLAGKDRRFPRKGTCLAIYSHTVNAQCDLSQTLERSFPWCVDWEEALRTLFAAYVEAKQARSVLDYDDLLLYWNVLMQEPAMAHEVGRRFDHVLVDEYQDTNKLQAAILTAMKPDGRGVTVVGDDAQSIYSFRSAEIRNILDFAEQYPEPTRVVALEQNYRSVQPILTACNRVIGEARERFAKNLFSTRASQQKPLLVRVADESAQVDYVVERVLARREEGVPLRSQAVLFRSGHHSDALEVELGRRGIPFVKYGGLKFLEAAHVKDLLCILRWIENPRDAVAAHRVLQLLPGVGPAGARRVCAHLAAGGHRFERLRAHRIAAAAAADWPALCELLEALQGDSVPWGGQVERVREWYSPQLERLYDAAAVREGDLDQLEQVAASQPTRERFLSELVLDPPSATGDEAGDPRLDEDWLVLSTIHSAKGQEWDSVIVLNVVDGCIPSDMSVRDEEQVEEERRLLYVAMTRARDALALVQPLRFYVHGQRRRGDKHVYAPRSRFLTDEVLACFECVGGNKRELDAQTRGTGARPRAVRVDVAARMRAMWSS